MDDLINAKREDDEIFFVFHSFVHPPSVFRYDLKSAKTICLESPKVNFPFEDYVTEQVFVSSRDGTKIPMFLVHHKKITKNQKNRTLLYGYGGFNISLTPGFMVNRLVWLEQGNIFAMANLRGGGEYGETWHQAGRLKQKQNTFDDMIACAEFLINSGYTSNQQLAIEGRSNGGLLIGACLTQRPELFGAALPAVGVMDMLRFHKFTIGWAWVSDYGSPDDPDLYPILRSYSPLHNIKTGIHYPPTLITTADHDDRVVPGHSFKFCATLQSAQAGSAPILIRIQSKAGHGFGKPLTALLDEQCDILAFLMYVLE
jgi:prolyl oligopeptidase